MCRQGPGCGPPRSAHTGEELPLRSTCKSTRRHELGPRTGRGDTHHGYSRLIRGKQDFTEQRTRVGVQNPCCSLRAPCGLPKSESREDFKEGRTRVPTPRGWGLQRSPSSRQRDPQSAGRTRCACVPVCASCWGTGAGTEDQTRTAGPAHARAAATLLSFS